MLRMKTVSLDMFFDTDRVKRPAGAAGAAARRNLSKAGAFVSRAKWAQAEGGRYTPGRVARRRSRAVSGAGLVAGKNAQTGANHE